MHKFISGLKSSQHFSSKMAFPLMAQSKIHFMFKVWWQGNYSIHFGKNKVFVLGGNSNAYMYMYICMYFLFFFYNSDLTVKNHTEQQAIHF